MKELAEKFERQFTCLQENIRKCVIFPVPIVKELTRIGKSGKESKKLYLTD